jgi:hypothetical protein
MRTAMRLGTVTAVFLIMSALTGADDTKECKAIVEKAIAAAGGEEKLAQLQAATWRTRSSSILKTATATLAGQLPDKFRAESEAEIDGKAVRQVRIVNGDRGWIQINGKTERMSPEMVAASKITFYHKSLAWALLPLREPGLQFTPLGAAVVNGRQAVGIRVVQSGRPAVKMYFDRVTGLPVKTETILRDPKTGKDVTTELTYSDHRNFSGLNLPGRTTTWKDGQYFGHLEVLDFHPEKKLDDKLFQAP